MTDVFVSYKAEDRRRVKPLVEAFEAEGLSVWWDAQIGGGASWRQAIEAELNAAKCVVVVWSKRSAGPDGEFVQDEATRAQQRHVYVPVTIDKVHLPLGFGETQALSLVGWHGSREDSQFQAVLKAVCSKIGAEQLVHGQTHHDRRFFNRRSVLAGSTAAAAVAVAGAWFFGRPSAAQSESIAVLPFENLSGDPSQAYFSDGIAEELRSALARIPGLKVVARTSSEAMRNADAQTAASKLHVQDILTGSVRKSPQMLRISAQLIDGKDGTERWSEVYDRPIGDALQIQSDIARKVTDALAIRLGPSAGRLKIAGTSNPNAYDLFLKGVAVRQSGHTEDNLRAAIALFDTAIASDPKFADAYALKAITISELTGGFADSGPAMRQGLAQASRAAREAISLSADSPYAHAALAAIQADLLQLKAADSEYRRAVSQNGADAVILDNYCHFLGLLGYTRRALELGARVVSIDPLNSRSYNVIAGALYYGHRYADAAQEVTKVLALTPENSPALMLQGDSFFMLGRYDAARASYVKTAADSVFRLTSEGVLDERLGNHSASAAAANKIRQLFGDAASYQLAQIEAQRGKKDAAFAALQQALELPDPGIISIRTDPFLDPLRSDARFQAILKKIDFPD
jgi:TolB-like protein/Tfp pilus assembly protein PilF